MRKRLFIVTVAVGLALVSFFLWQTGRQTTGYAVADLIEPSYSAARPEGAIFSGFLGVRINEALNGLPPTSTAQKAEQIEGLSELLLALQHLGAPTAVIQKQIKFAIRPFMSDRADHYQKLWSDPANTHLSDVWSSRSELLALLYFYRVTGQKQALQSCEARLSLLKNFLDNPGSASEIPSPLAQTMLEPLALMYLFTGEDHYRRICEAFMQKGGFKGQLFPSEDLEINESPGTALAFLRGLLEVYLFKSDPALLEFCSQGWESLHAEGAPHKYLLEWLHLTGRLYELSGDIRYVDEMEHVIYNELLAVQTQWENGKSIGTASPERLVAGLTAAPRYSSGRIHDKLVVNFYEDGDYTAKLPLVSQNLPVNYTIDTNYPRNGTVEIVISPERSAHFSLLLRVPSWCTDFSVHVNHEVYVGQAGQYLDLSRDWLPGDIVRICMDMSIRPHNNAGQDSLVWARGPQILARPTELQALPELPSNWRGSQYYNLTLIRQDRNERAVLVPLADACQLGQIAAAAADTANLPMEIPSAMLSQLRSQLQTLRREFGGANDMPDVGFFLFGMGNRRKLFYRDGLLKELFTADTLAHWPISHQTIVPNEYRVNLLSLGGDTIAIYENEQGVYIQKDQQPPSLVSGTTAPLHLPAFEGHPYSQVLRVLHHEILINIVDSQPLPNLLVYNNPWRRDGAMMAMCLEKTGNMEIMKDWVLTLDSPYDFNNKMDGIPEEEPDNLGQTLYLLSLFSNQEHPLVADILAEIPKFQKSRFGKKYIQGRTDFGKHPAYQTKWLKYGLQKMGLPDPYQTPAGFDDYRALFWWDRKDRQQEGKDLAGWRFYPYIGWANDHYYGTKFSPISNRDYPLTWEIEASQADYEKMKIIDASYYLERNSSPHTWHAAEVFLYLFDM